MHFDDDVELTDPTVIRRAVDLMREHPECGVVAFRQVMPDGSIPDMQPLPVDRLSYSSFFFGYAFLLRTKPFRELGGLYEYFEFYLEENEYSLRLFGAGFRVLYDPSLMVVHHQDPRGRRDHRRTSRLLARNSLWMAIRHFPAWILPAASTKVLFNHVRRCHAQGGSDWLGLTWIMGQTARALPRLLKERRPMPYASIAAWRRHRLKPTPLEDAGTAAAAVGHSA
jgi:GT2 family glycosyltransferase